MNLIRWHIVFPNTCGEARVFNDPRVGWTTNEWYSNGMNFSNHLMNGPFQNVTKN